MKNFFDRVLEIYSTSVEEVNNNENTWYERIFFLFVSISMFVFLVAFALISFFVFLFFLFEIVAKNIITILFSILFIFIFAAYKTLVKRNYIPSVFDLYKKLKNK